VAVRVLLREPVQRRRPRERRGEVGLQRLRQHDLLQVAAADPVDRGLDAPAPRLAARRPASRRDPGSRRAVDRRREPASRSRSVASRASTASGSASSPTAFTVSHVPLSANVTCTRGRTNRASGNGPTGRRRTLRRGRRTRRTGAGGRPRSRRGRRRSRTDRRRRPGSRRTDPGRWRSASRPRRWRARARRRGRSTSFAAPGGRRTRPQTRAHRSRSCGLTRVDAGDERARFIGFGSGPGNLYVDYRGDR